MHHATITGLVPIRLSPVTAPDTIYGVLGLTGDPFPDRPDRPSEQRGGAWIAIPSREAVRNELTSWITDPAFPIGPDRTGGGLAVVTGDAGSGRTSLIAALAASLADRSDLFVARVPDDGNRRSDALLLRAMIAALGATPAGRTGRELIAEVRALLTAHLDAGRRPVLLIDNAALGGSQLEILRMVLVPTTAEAGTAGARIVLFGPPALDDRIRRRRALATMVGGWHVLPPLDDGEVIDLLTARIEATRSGALPGPLFVPDALAVISEWSGGNPAAAIRLAATCLREAIARGQSSIDDAIARQAARELADETRLVTPVGKPGEPSASVEPEALVIQTKLDLGFGDEEPELAASGRAIRNRRRRS